MIGEPRLARVLKSLQYFSQEVIATMTTISLIKEAILALKDRTGSSVQAINKWIEAEKKVCGAQRKLLRYTQSRLFGGTRVFSQKGHEYLECRRR